MRVNLVGIYAFYSKTSGFRYIGQSVNLERRKKDHLRELTKNSHSAKHFQNIFNKYGQENIEYCVLEYCDPSNLTLNEQKWMDVFKPTGLFNVAPAANTQRGIVYGPDIREKMSASKRGKVTSEETKKKMSLSASGKIRTLQHTINIGLARKGQPGHLHSAESRKKISLANSGKVKTSEHVCNMVAAKKRNGTTGLGIALSDEHRAKISLSNKGKVNSLHSIEKMKATVKGRIGKPHSEAIKEKMRIARAKQIISPLSFETRQKIKAAMIGRYRSPESTAKMIATTLRNKILKQTAIV